MTREDVKNQNCGESACEMTTTPTGEATPATTTRREARSYMPTVDIVETAEEILLRADVPGATAENVEITFDRGLLTVRVAVSQRYDVQKTRFLLQEYGVGDFQRSFRLSDQIAADKITADVSNGVLTLHLPKAEALRPRRIEVKAS